MKKQAGTRETCSIWRKSWAVKALALFVAFFTLLACSPKGDAEAPEPESDKRIELLQKGWLGRFGAQDPFLSELLTDQQGWADFQEMELFEAIRNFSASPDRASGIGAIRTYSAMAQMYVELDSLMLEVELNYLASLEEPPKSVLERIGLLKLKAGDVDGAKALFFEKGARGDAVATTVGRAGVLYAQGSREEALALFAKAAEAAANREERALVRMSAYSLGLDQDIADAGYYGQALDALANSDLFSAVVSLQVLEEPWHEMSAGPDIYLYPLFAEVFARMAIERASSMKGFAAKYGEGKARLLIGDPGGALAAFSAALEDMAPEVPEDDASWLYGPELGKDDALALVKAYSGEALYMLGKGREAEQEWKTLIAQEPGALTLARMASSQVAAKAGAPLGDPRQVAESAIAATLALKDASLDIEPGGEAISALLNVRLASIYRYASRVAAANADADGALDYLDRAHWKRKGNKPSFVNPPSFVVELAKAYFRAGQYAPAVDLMFAMSSHFPSSRMAYEGLKRLYASKSGGEAPPL